MSRAYYIDRIRVILTVLVVLHHTAITYGAPGGWYLNEIPGDASPTGLFFVLFVSVNQAYFMGFFFLLAGYFTPASYSRKGPARFATDRFVRLGIPLAVYGFLLNPLAISISRPPFTMAAYLHRVTHTGWGPGPLWFAEALLLFSAAYMVWRPAASAEMPSARSWFFSALAVGGGALVFRQFWPLGMDFMGMQLGFFSSYIFLFVVGTLAAQYDWLNRLAWPHVRPWAIFSIVLLPAMVVTAALSGALDGKPVNFNGGFGIPAIVYAFWEPLVAWGIIGAYLVWFRDRFNRPSALWEYLATRAYAVYIVHAPVLVGVSMVLRFWHAPALEKFAVTGSLALVVSLAVSTILLMIPGARRVL
jgi:hypothetical protein